MYNRVKKFISKSIIIEREGEYPTPVSLTGVITFVINPRRMRRRVTVVVLCVCLSIRLSVCLSVCLLTL